MRLIYLRNYYYLKWELDSPSGKLSEVASVAWIRAMYTHTFFPSSFHQPAEQRPLYIKFLVPRTDLLISFFLMIANPTFGDWVLWWYFPDSILPFLPFLPFLPLFFSLSLSFTLSFFLSTTKGVEINKSVFSFQILLVRSSFSQWGCSVIFFVSSLWEAVSWFKWNHEYFGIICCRVYGIIS